MIDYRKENKQLKESAKLAADANFKLSEQVYNLKAENERLKGIIDFWQKGCADAEAENTELEAKNEKLKKEVKQIGSAFIKKGDYARELEKKLEFSRTHKSIHALQEIKAIAETYSSGIECEECPFTDDCKTDSQALGVCRMILKLITKAEEEWKILKR